MKKNFLSLVSILFLGASAVPLMGASACTYTTVNSDGTVRVESDGHVRINRGRFCVRARNGADYVSGSAWLKLRYRVRTDRRNIERSISLSGRNFDCKTVTFPEPVEIQDVDIVFATLELNGRNYRNYDVVENRYVEETHEASKYIEFQIGDSHASNDQLDPEVRFALQSAGASDAGLEPIARISDEDRGSSRSTAGDGADSSAEPVDAAI